MTPPHCLTSYYGRSSQSWEQVSQACSRGFFVRRSICQKFRRRVRQLQMRGWPCFTAASEHLKVETVLRPTNFGCKQRLRPTLSVSLSITFWHMKKRVSANEANKSMHRMSATLCQSKRHRFIERHLIVVDRKSVV